MQPVRHTPFDPPPHRVDAVETGELVYTSGLTCADPTGSIEEQARSTLERLDVVLAEASTDKTRLVWANVWLADITDIEAFNEVWLSWLPEGCAPARACVEARLARPELKVEVAVVAAK